MSYLFKNNKLHIHADKMKFRLESYDHRSMETYKSFINCLNAVDDFVELSLEDHLEFIKFKNAAVGVENE